MKKFFEKIKTNAYKLNPKEEKVLKEINQYTTNLNNKVKEIESNNEGENK